MGVSRCRTHKGHFEGQNLIVIFLKASHEEAPQYLGPLFFAHVIVVQEMHWAYTLHSDASPVPCFVLIWRPSELSRTMEKKELYEVALVSS